MSSKTLYNIQAGSRIIKVFCLVSCLFFLQCTTDSSNTRRGTVTEVLQQANHIQLKLNKDEHHYILENRSAQGFNVEQIRTTLKGKYVVLKLHDQSKDKNLHSVRELLYKGRLLFKSNK